MRYRMLLLCGQSQLAFGDDGIGKGQRGCIVNGIIPCIHASPVASGLTAVLSLFGRVGMSIASGCDSKLLSA